MAFKEGVEEAQVHAWRGLVAIARDLDVQVDAGQLTPDEAFAKLDETMDGMAKPKKAKAEKEHAKA